MPLDDPGKTSTTKETTSAAERTAAAKRTSAAEITSNEKRFQIQRLIRPKRRLQAAISPG
jgi:hypothetical protein